MQGDDELIEAVAKVLRFEIGDDIDVWLEDGTAQRAARAVTPLLLERAAQVAWLQSKQGATHEQIAAAIRALAKEPGNG